MAGNPLWFAKLEVPPAHRPSDGFAVKAVEVGADALAEGSFFRRGDGGGKVFMDGSCAAPLSVYPRAAGCVVQVSVEGAAIPSITFAVPAGWSQTATADEHFWMAICRQFVEQGVLPATDCGFVFLAALHAITYATHEKRPWAAIWSGDHFGRAFKVKAHLSLE